MFFSMRIHRTTRARYVYIYVYIYTYVYFASNYNCDKHRVAMRIEIFPLLVLLARVCVCARICERVRVYAHRTCTMEIKSGGKKYEFRDIDDATCNVTLDRVILRVFNNAVYVYVIRAQQTRNNGERRKFVTTTSHAYVAKYRSVFFSP